MPPLRVFSTDFDDLRKKEGFSVRQEVIQKAPEQPKKQTPNLTGIPTQMKLDFERRSGLSFDDVRVHYNSDKPRKIGALAYTQIPQVHIGPGQERHLRHELGHVVQQKQGIVRPTTWISGLPVNDSPHLEHLADTTQRMHSTEHNPILSNVSAIQCAGGQVAVSLSPAANPLFRLDDLEVDTIKVFGRFDTSLPGNVQGHHTVADILIKKHQQHMFRNLSAKKAIQKYREMGSYLSAQESSLASDPSYDKLREVIDQHMAQQLGTPGAVDAAAAVAAAAPAPDSRSASSRWFPSHLIHDIYRNNSFRASLYAFMKQCSILEAHDETNIHEWRKQFNLMVWLYNDAYSHSPAATTLTGVKGDGESMIPVKLKAAYNRVRDSMNKRARRASQGAERNQGLNDLFEAFVTALDQISVTHIPVRKKDTSRQGDLVSTPPRIEEEIVSRFITNSSTKLSPQSESLINARIPIFFYMLQDYYNRLVDVSTPDRSPPFVLKIILDLPEQKQEPQL